MAMEKEHPHIKSYSCIGLNSLRALPQQPLHACTLPWCAACTKTLSTTSFMCRSFSGIEEGTEGSDSPTPDSNGFAASDGGDNGSCLPLPPSKINCTAAHIPQRRHDLMKATDFLCCALRFHLGFFAGSFLGSFVFGRVLFQPVRSYVLVAATMQFQLVHRSHCRSSWLAKDCEHVGQTCFTMRRTSASTPP